MPRGEAIHFHPRSRERIERELSGAVPLDRAAKTRLALTGDPNWVGIKEAGRIWAIKPQSLYVHDYRLFMTTKSAGIPGRGGGVLLVRAEVEAVKAIRRELRVSFGVALRIFSSRAALLRLLGDGIGDKCASALEQIRRIAAEAVGHGSQKDTGRG